MNNTTRKNKYDEADPEGGRLHEEETPARRTCKLHHCHGVLLAAIVVLVLVFFIFVIFPVILMKSAKLQRKFLFITSDSYIHEPISINDFSNGTRHMYVVVNETENITLGVVHYLPLALINRSSEYGTWGTFEYAYTLTLEKYPVLLYFHGNGESRFGNCEAFKRFREYFHVIAFDYRSYGDSTEAELSEEGVIQDSVVLYKWVRDQTGQDNIYVWGKSLGAAFATHTLARLHEEKITSMGLILEAPFTNLRDEMKTIPYIKIFSWLPWFEITILDGFKNNGFVFNTTQHIMKVDCPIMILHAEDDSVVPYTLGKKLSQVAQEKRNPHTQGIVTFHLFAAQFNYNHWRITNAPELDTYVQYYISTCKKYFNDNKNSIEI